MNGRGNEQCQTVASEKDGTENVVKPVKSGMQNGGQSDSLKGLGCNMNLPSYAFCVSDENGFVDFADFYAMAINFAIEKEMGLL